MTFSDLGLIPELCQAVESQGYTKPSPIQEKAIPSILEGRDIMAAAQTGTGKTAGFTLPLLQLLNKGQKARANQVRALVLTPTRELAAQVADNVEKYGQHLDMRYDCVFGGVKVNPQMQRLTRGTDILVATPGRLLDLFNQRAIKFNQLETIVFDEADRMLDMGFIHDIKKILSVLPKDRQTLMFSATFSPDIRALAKNLVNNPVEVDATPRNTTVKKVTQWIHPVDKKRKPELLTQLILNNNKQQVLVFSRTKHGANKLVKILTSAKIACSAIHGNKSQGARTRALAEFKDGDIQVLVATDIAARGIDIHQLPQVINVDLPNVAEDYVHRIGRTGRAGADGQAISLVSADEYEYLCDIESLIQNHLERKVLVDYDPDHRLPESKPIRAPKKTKKTKASKVNFELSPREKPARTGNKPNNSSRSKPNNKSANKPGNKPAKRNEKPARSDGKSGNAGNTNKSIYGNKKNNTGSGNSSPRKRPSNR